MDQDRVNHMNDRMLPLFTQTIILNKDFFRFSLHEKPNQCIAVVFANMFSIPVMNIKNKI
ncbi:hypothetical protein BLOT_006857 [Blomia tropicalis]|nr:hypothetical protein BLOT_006857 [Blomia tropicalis]